jgi:glycosyltransferase involved in cell wall biosynthesis
LGRLAVFMLGLFNGNRAPKTVHTFHGHVLEGYFSRTKTTIFKLIEKWLARHCSAIIAISKSQKHELVHIHRITESKKVHQINLGFDLSRFLTVKANRGTFRKENAIDDDALVIGIVGRLVPIKNHVLFLKSAQLFRNRYHHRNAIFVVIGDGELRSTLESFAGELGVADSVLFCGWELDIHKVYADLDIVALTSNNEGTPVSLIEAMASGVPIITTGVGGVEDLLGKQLPGNPDANGFIACERGMLCSRNDPRAFAAGLDYIVRHDLKQNTDRLAKAQHFVLQHYSDKKLVEKIEALYNDLLLT